MKNETLYKTFKIKTFNDADPQNPREDTTLGKMATYHREYILSDKEYSCSEEMIQDILSDAGVETEKAAIQAQKMINDIFSIYKQLKDLKEIALIFPLYLLDHSGLSMATHRQSQWDSSYIGFLYITKERICEEYNVKRISKKLLNKVSDILVNEVVMFDKYLTGAVHGYKITNKNDEFVDSCFNYFDEDAMLCDAKDFIDNHIKQHPVLNQLELAF